MNEEHGSVLVVDDNQINRDLLSRRVRQQGHSATLAENGRQALELLRAQPFDLILLDIMMPEMNGYEVLAELKDDPALRHLPVIMISALDDLESVVRCIELGADDYLSKPFNPVLLRARIAATLEKKRLRDKEQAYLQQLVAEQEKSERLLLNVLPQRIAERLKSGQQVIADSYPDVTVLFADIVDFTPLSAQVAPADVVAILNRVFSTFDQLAERYGLEKIKTLGDSYMLAGGLPDPRPDHAEAVAEMALAMRREAARIVAPGHGPVRLRIGLHSGPVVAGVIGIRKFIYDLWGDAVNTASRMESQGLPDCIQVTEPTYERLRDRYCFSPRGPLEVKGKGAMMTYMLTGRRPGVAAPV
jgi:adenylate cyclase